MKLSLTCFARWQAFFLLFIISVSLLNIEYFFNSNGIAYYGTCTVILFYTTFNFVFANRDEQMLSRTPVIVFSLWCLYVLYNYLTHQSTLVFTIYSISLCFLLLTSISFFNSPNLRLMEFCIGIAAISIIESLYCFIQYLGFVKSQNIYFKVTGSWDNPNVTAIFLALTVPFFLYLLKYKNKKLILGVFIILLSALLMLKCRAAFIGTILSIIVFYGLEYRFVDWAKNKKNSLSVKAFLILSLIISISAFSYLYNAKKDSADGRKFIWKLSAAMTLEKPTGYGYGYFEKEYNLFQANYIKKGDATPEELTNSGPVIMPHNELLLHAVEGGFIGLLLISLFFGSLLFTIKKKKGLTQNDNEDERPEISKNSLFNLAYAGIISFTAISMVNSTTQIMPAMCLLIIYTAMVCSTTEPISFLKDIHFFKTDKFSIIIKAGIITISIYLLYLLIILAVADRQNKKAKLLKEAGNYEQTLHILTSLNPTLKENSDYWQNYGHLHFKMQRFDEAIACFEKAKKFSSLPPLYLGTGKIYEKLKQYPQAVWEYETLVALYPSKFLYRMLLLEMYLKNKDIPNAISMAEEIIRLKPKVPSEKVEQYKNNCRGLLLKLGVTRTTIKKFQTQ